MSEQVSETAPTSVNNVDRKTVTAGEGEAGTAPAIELDAQPTTRWNDALVIGVDDLSKLDPEIFNRQITIAFGGTKLVDGKPLGAKDNYPKNKSATVGHLFERLTKFQRGPKNAEYLLQGEEVEGAPRRKENMRVNDLFMKDRDTGESIDEAIERALRTNTLTLIWTTHSHMKPTTGIKENAIVHFLKDKGTPTNNTGDVTAEQIAAYLMEIKKVRPEFMVDLKRIPNQHVDGGLNSSYSTSHIHGFASCTF